MIQKIKNPQPEVRNPKPETLHVPWYHRTPMAVTYYKRFRMEIDLGRTTLEVPMLPPGFVFVPWQAPLLERHAVAKFASFRGEVDSELFPSLGELSGCRDLMSEIVQRASFIPQATWLIGRDGRDDRKPSAPPAYPVDCREPAGDCGTIQGVVQLGGWGAIQNVGVTPDCRGLGLGRSLVLRCLAGFREAKVPQVYLEVTARNTPAVALYRSVGFRLARTTYKAVDRPTAAYAVL